MLKYQPGEYTQREAYEATLAFKIREAAISLLPLAEAAKEEEGQQAYLASENAEIENLRKEFPNEFESDVVIKLRTELLDRIQAKLARARRALASLELAAL